MKHFSLFAGIGGIDLAAEWAGFETVGMCEIDEYCRKVLDRHWPDVPKWRDVFDLTGEEIIETCGEIDLISGGFPCQPFSTTGKRKGCADERHLWPELLRIICEVRPRWFLGENVRGLLSIDSGRVFGRILRDLAENGYRAGWVCYGAGDVGAPHKRERVFIVAHTGNPGQQARGRQEPRGRGEFSGHGGHEKKLGDACQRRLPPAGPEQQAAGITGAGSQGTEGTAQPSMGRVPDGIPAGLHGNWPAGPGNQHEWEPPRIATGVKDRVARLKCLGNAVVPQQVYPILKSIYDVN